MENETSSPDESRPLTKHNVNGSADRTKPITLNKLISIFTELKAKMKNGEYRVAVVH